jgi:hypothetical protein
MLDIVFLLIGILMLIFLYHISHNLYLYLINFTLYH